MTNDPTLSRLVNGTPFTVNQLYGDDMNTSIAMKLEGMSLASMGQNRKIKERDMYRFLARKGI